MNGFLDSVCFLTLYILGFNFTDVFESFFAHAIVSLTESSAESRRKEENSFY